MNDEYLENPIGFYKHENFILNTKEDFTVWYGDNDSPISFVDDVTEAVILRTDEKSVYVSTSSESTIYAKILMHELSDNLGIDIITTEDIDTVRIRVENALTFNPGEQIFLYNLYICLIVCKRGNVMFLGSNDLTHMIYIHETDSIYSDMNQLPEQTENVYMGSSGSKILDLVLGRMNETDLFGID